MEKQAYLLVILQFQDNSFAKQLVINEDINFFDLVNLTNVGNRDNNLKGFGIQIGTYSINMLDDSNKLELDEYVSDIVPEDIDCDIANMCGDMQFNYQSDEDCLAKYKKTLEFLLESVGTEFTVTDLDYYDLDSLQYDLRKMLNMDISMYL